MVNTHLLAKVFLLIAPIILTGCTEQEQATDDIKSSVQQQQSSADNSNQQQVQPAESNSDLDKLIDTESEVHLQDLMHQVAQARRYAEIEGFVWSTTEPLIEKGYAAAKAGNEEQARAFFQEAKLQFKLSIEQARYAAQHWKLLVPEDV